MTSDFFKDLAEDLEEDLKNGGHTALMEDLLGLMREASEFQFHDYKNTKYATPKVELRSKLLRMADQVMEGRYDN